MVGRNVDELFPKVPHSMGETVLDVSELSGVRVPRSVSLKLRSGEVMGLFGLIGAGRTETLRHLMGLDGPSSGSVLIRGRQGRATPQARIRDGLGIVSEDRKGEGLSQSMSIVDNLTLSDLKPYSKLGLLNLAKRRKEADRWMKTLSIKARSPLQSVSQLSGGNQQKVAIARVLHQNATILLLDEPTRGIDVGTKAEIYQWVGELAAKGKSILFVSSYLPELMAVCDTIGVMAKGRLREVRPTLDWTQGELLSVAVSKDEESQSK